MRRISLSHLFLFTLGIFLVAGSAHAAIEDFSGDLSNFTHTVILDDNGGASNVSTWTIVGGELSLETASYDGIEQHAYIYDGASLAVGEELRADISSVPITGNRNLGLYVGGTAPTTGVRQDYIVVYANPDVPLVSENAATRVLSRGFDGTTEYDNPFVNFATDATALFIARTDVNTFDAGYYVGETKTVVTTRTPTTPNTADYIGFYADVREAGTIGYVDNLEPVPAPPAPPVPATGFLGQLVMLGLVTMLATLLISRRQHAS